MQCLCSQVGICFEKKEEKSLEMFWECWAQVWQRGGMGGIQGTKQVNSPAHLRPVSLLFGRQHYKEVIFQILRNHWQIVEYTYKGCVVCCKQNPGLFPDKSQCSDLNKACCGGSLTLWLGLKMGLFNTLHGIWDLFTADSSSLATLVACTKEESAGSSLLDICLRKAWKTFDSLWKSPRAFWSIVVLWRLLIFVFSLPFYCFWLCLPKCVLPHLLPFFSFPFLFSVFLFFTILPKF